MLNAKLGTTPKVRLEPKKFFQLVYKQRHRGARIRSPRRLQQSGPEESERAEYHCRLLDACADCLGRWPSAAVALERLPTQQSVSCRLMVTDGCGLWQRPEHVEDDEGEL